MKWINIKDELPKEDECGVLTYGKRGISNFYATMMWYKERFIDVTDEELPEYITHWMPLPDPPEEEGCKHENTEELNGLQHCLDCGGVRPLKNA